MPRRNVVRYYGEDAYYHVYNRGVNKRKIFLDEQDYAVFLDLLRRHLTREKIKDGHSGFYESYAGRLELLCFCLMPNHFHLLLYINLDPTSVSELMKRVQGAYTVYFNKKYQRIGPLFEGAYKASRIDNDAYLFYISRYIHRNPKDYMNWQYSSLPYYLKGWEADWVVPDKIFKLYEWGTYEAFLKDDQGHNWGKEELKDVLAND